MLKSHCCCCRISQSSICQLISRCSTTGNIEPKEAVRSQSFVVDSEAHRSASRESRIRIQGVASI